MTLQDMKKGQERLRLNRDEANRRPTITRSGACIEHRQQPRKVVQAKRLWFAFVHDEQVKNECKRHII